MKISTYILTYTIVAPNGDIYPTKEVVLYTASQKRAVQLLEKEIRRRLGSGYHWHIMCTRSKSHETV